MCKPLSEIPESSRFCPFCKSEGKVVRVMPYGADKSQQQFKLECPKCPHSWLYHTDDNTTDDNTTDDNTIVNNDPYIETVSGGGGITMKRESSDLICGEDLEKMVVTLKAIAHPLRLQIVNILMSGEQPVKELVRILETKQSLTSQQLSILRVSGVLKFRRNGNVVFYRIHNNSVKNIMTTILRELD